MARVYKGDGRVPLSTKEEADLLCKKKRVRIVENNNKEFELQDFEGKTLIPGTLEIRLWSKIVNKYRK